jgi:hypothetical protein
MNNSIGAAIGRWDGDQQTYWEVPAGGISAKSISHF